MFPTIFHDIRTVSGLSLAIGLLAVAPATAAELSYEGDIKPLLEQYCYECHDSANKKGSLDLEILTRDSDLYAKPTLMEDLEWVVGEEEMPPADAKQPTAEERKRLVDWMHESILAIQNASPDDPGVVVMPRISSEEYDYVVRDLTGVDLSLGQYLTADGVAGEGFLNVGAAQSMTVGQFEGFLSTAKKLMLHARITPWEGFLWDEGSLSPLEKDEDLRKSLEAWWYGAMRDQSKQLVEEHTNQVRKATNMLFGAYFEAAWQYKYRDQLGMPDATVDEIAESYETPLFPNSVRRAIRMLTGEEMPPVKFDLEENPFVQVLRERWNEIPAPTTNDKSEYRKEFAQLGKDMERLAADNRYGTFRASDLLIDPRDNPRVKDGKAKRDNILLRLNDDAIFEMDIDLTKSKTGEVYLTVSEQYDGPEGDLVRWHSGEIELENGEMVPWNKAITSFENRSGEPIAWGAHPTGAAMPDGAITVPGGDYAKFQIPDGAKSLKVFAEIDPEFADTTTVAALPYDHAVDDFVRLPGGSPLGALVRHGDKKAFKAARKLGNDMGQFNNYLSDRGVSAWLTQNSAFEMLPPEIRDALGVGDQDLFGRDGFLALSSQETYDRMPGALRNELKRVAELARDIPRLESADEETLTAQARKIVKETATQAWRRLPTDAELEGLVHLYQQEREGGRSWEASVKTPLVAITSSAPFLYRATRSLESADPYPLRDTEIANRLASILWGSLPDEELLALAAEDQLSNPDVLRQQVDRMLQDERASAFVEQFTGLWLGFHNFDQFGGPDAEKFEEFDEPLKKAMYEEARLFFLDLVQNDQPVTDALFSDTTFLNERLAKHYGIDGVSGPAMRKVNLDTNQRGGILGMGAFLTKNSKPLRTSPVHRGIWVYEHVLGRPVPEPPPNVPLLSDEEVDEEGQTIAEQLEQHRSDPACFGCHDRFDPLGIALENFDPIGRWRTEVVEGAPVDANGVFGDGSAVNGIEGLRGYFEENRQTFRENFARKLIAYTLGREFLLTDKPLLEQVLATMDATNDSVRAALGTVVTSKQFLMKRDEADRLSENDNSNTEPGQIVQNQ